MFPGNVCRIRRRDPRACNVKTAGNVIGKLKSSSEGTGIARRKRNKTRIEEISFEAFNGEKA